MKSIIFNEAIIRFKRGEGAIKLRLIKVLIKWLWQRYPYLLQDVVIPDNSHIHKNPKKKVTK